MRTTRRRMLGGGMAGVAAVATGVVGGRAVRPQLASGAPSEEQDARILGALLMLEEAQAALYEGALRRGALSGDLLRFAQVVAPHEREHVRFLRRALGRRAGGPARTDVRAAVSGAERFSEAAIMLEEATAAAYIAHGADLTDAAMQDAARIVAVEARHAAWIRDIAGADPAPHAADPGRSADAAITDLRRRGILR